MSNEGGLERLQRILIRARRKAALRRAGRAKTKEKSIAEDYADRLAERAKFRLLLEDIRLDGLRFRWYFEHVERSTDLSQLRTWIDGKIAERDSAQRVRQQTAPAPTPHSSSAGESILRS